jgi:hypothetical protein
MSPTAIIAASRKTTRTSTEERLMIKVGITVYSVTYVPGCSLPLRNGSPEPSVDLSLIGSGLFPYTDKPYDRRLLPAPFPVGEADGVLIIEDPQAIERSEKLVTTVTDVPSLQALPVEISMEPLDHNDSTGLQRVDDFYRVARDHCVHVYTHH